MTNIVRNVIIEGSFQRQQATAEVTNSCEIFPAVDTTVTYAYTIPKFLAYLQNRAPASASVDTVPDASALIAQVGALAPGMTFRHRVINSGAGVITMTAAANTGATVTSPTINATSFKDFLVTITNGTPTATLTNVTTTNASAVLTGLTQAQTDSVSVGMLVQNAVAGQQGRTIIGIVSGVSITLSGTSTASLTGQTFTFYPTYTVQGIGQGTL